MIATLNDDRDAVMVGPVQVKRKAECFFAAAPNACPPDVTHDICVGKPSILVFAIFDRDRRMAENAHHPNYRASVFAKTLGRET